jgi:hypothetical protein
MQCEDRAFLLLGLFGCKGQLFVQAEIGSVQGHTQPKAAKFKVTAIHPGPPT